MADQSRSGRIEPVQDPTEVEQPVQNQGKVVEEMQGELAQFKTQMAEFMDFFKEQKGTPAQCGDEDKAHEDANYKDPIEEEQPEQNQGKKIEQMQGDLTLLKIQMVELMDFLKARKNPPQGGDDRKPDGDSIPHHSVRNVTQHPFVEEIPDDQTIPDFDNPEEQERLRKANEEAKAKQKYETLEARLRKMEGFTDDDILNVAEMGLVSDVVIPPKFKVPDFNKYVGTSCPRAHLLMYSRRMAAYANDEKLLMHIFQDSLIDGASDWYMSLDRHNIRSWKNLAEEFLRYYKFNKNVAPDRTQLQSMKKGKDEPLKDFAQKWREVALRVQPPMSDSEMTITFLRALGHPYYGNMVGYSSNNFSELVVIGERIESGIKDGFMEISSAGDSSQKKSQFGKKKEEVYTLEYQDKGKWNGKQINQNQPRQQHDAKNQHFDPVPMPYSQLLPQLLKSSLVALVPSLPRQPPYPSWYNENLTCAYHAGARGHDVDNCITFKKKVQELINAKWLSFDPTPVGPDVNSNPLPNHDNHKG